MDAASSLEKSSRVIPGLTLLLHPFCGGGGGGTDLPFSGLSSAV